MTITGITAQGLDTFNAFTVVNLFTCPIINR